MQKSLGDLQNNGFLALSLSKQLLVCVTIQAWRDFLVPCEDTCLLRLKKPMHRRHNKFPS